MSDQDKLDAYNKGFYCGYDGLDRDNPYFPAVIHSGKTVCNDAELWDAYEKGYLEGVAERKQVRNAKPAT